MSCPDTPVLARRSWEERSTSLLGHAFRSAKKVVSVEVLPPLGADASGFVVHLDQLDRAGVAFVNIPDGPRASTRAGSLHLAAFANRDPRRRLKVFPHLTARDRNLIALQADLLGAAINGVSDVFVVTGDRVETGARGHASAVQDVDSIGLTALIDGLNRGLGSAGDPIGHATDFGIGVAVNPGADDLERETQRWLLKCESGADFAITQMVFDPEIYLRWRDRVGGQAWRPHLVGIWPLLSLRNAEFLATQVPGVKVPAALIEELRKSESSPGDAVARGLDIAHKTMERLLRDCDGFSVIAPFNKVDVAISLVKRLALSTP
jgi:methionine synthase / methylenetetrahydrofolate reductase(NADPH)